VGGWGEKLNVGGHCGGGVVHHDYPGERKLSAHTPEKKNANHKQRKWKNPLLYPKNRQKTYLWVGGRGVQYYSSTIH